MAYGSSAGPAVRRGNSFKRYRVPAILLACTSLLGLLVCVAFGPAFRRPPAAEKLHFDGASHTNQTKVAAPANETTAAPLINLMSNLIDQGNQSNATLADAEKHGQQAAARRARMEEEEVHEEFRAKCTASWTTDEELKQKCYADGGSLGSLLIWEDVPCPAGSEGTSVKTGCQCKAGYEGQITRGKHPTQINAGHCETKYCGGWAVDGPQYLVPQWYSGGCYSVAQLPGVPGLGEAADMLHSAQPRKSGPTFERFSGWPLDMNLLVWWDGMYTHPCDVDAFVAGLRPDQGYYYDAAAGHGTGFCKAFPAANAASIRAVYKHRSWTHHPTAGTFVPVASAGGTGTLPKSTGKEGPIYDLSIQIADMCTIQPNDPMMQKRNQICSRIPKLVANFYIGSQIANKKHERYQDFSDIGCTDLPLKGATNYFIFGLLIPEIPELGFDGGNLCKSAALGSTVCCVNAM